LSGWEVSTNRGSGIKLSLGRKRVEGPRRGRASDWGALLSKGEKKSGLWIASEVDGEKELEEDVRHWFVGRISG